MKKKDRRERVEMRQNSHKHIHTYTRTPHANPLPLCTKTERSIFYRIDGNERMNARPQIIKKKNKRHTKINFVIYFLLLSSAIFRKSTMQCKCALRTHSASTNERSERMKEKKNPSPLIFIVYGIFFLSISILYTHRCH